MGNLTPSNRTIYTSYGKAAYHPIYNDPQIRLKPNIQTNQEFNQALLKLVKNEALSKTEEELIKQSFIDPLGVELDDDDLKRLQEYLSIKKDNFNDSKDEPGTVNNDGLDLNPFKAVDKNLLNLKQSFFKEELELSQKKLKTILGSQYGAEDGIGKSIDKIIEKLGSVEKSDDFEAGLNDELKSRLQERAGQKPAEGKARPWGTSVLTDSELGLLIQGATSQPSKDIASLEKPANPIEANFNINNLPSSDDPITWYKFLQGAASHLDTTQQNKAKALLRKMQNLEPIGEDTQALEELMSMRDMPSSSGSVEGFKNSFNTSIEELKKKDPNDLSFDPILKASVEAEKTFPSSTAIATTLGTKMVGSPPMSLTLTNDEHWRKFNRALITLEDKNFKLTNPDIQYAIDNVTGLKAKLIGKTPSEQKDFLKKVLQRVQHDQQINQVKDPDLDPSKTGSREFYAQFKERVEYLFNHANDEARNDAGRKELEKEFVRFMQGGEIRANSPLAKELKERPELAEALNYFQKGFGNSDMNVGLIKSLFNIPGEDGEVPFNLHYIAQDSNSLDEVAQKIEIAVAHSTIDKNTKVPKELTDRSSGESTYYNFSEVVFDPEVQPNEKGQPIPTGEYKLLKDLRLSSIVQDSDPKQRLVVEDGKITNLPSGFKNLLTALQPGMTEKEIVDFLTKDKGIARLETAEDKSQYLAFNDKGAQLMTVLKQIAQERNSQFLDYQGYKPDQESYAETLSSRQNLIKLSNEYSLGIFDKLPLNIAYHPNEYKKALEDFTANSYLLQEHFDANINPHEKKDLNGKSDLFGTNVTAIQSNIDSTNLAASETPIAQEALAFNSGSADEQALLRILRIMDAAINGNFSLEGEDEEGSDPILSSIFPEFKNLYSTNPHSTKASKAFSSWA